MRRTRKISLALAFAAIFALVVSGYSATIYVSPAGDNTTGLSWTTAKTTVQAGIDAAVSGDEVWVRYGDYTGNITLNAGVKLYGGFVGNETSLTERPAFPRTTNVTTLIGSGGNSVVITPNSGTTVDNTRIDGFTIRGGSGSTYGGGIYCGYSVTIANNTITSNSAMYGGGLFINAGYPIVEDNTISSNTSTSTGGGGIYTRGSQPTIRNNTIQGNSVTGSGGAGGGIHGYGSPTIIDNTISENIADSAGGIFVNNSTALIKGNQITGNEATVNTGAIWSYCGSPIIEENIISGNHSDGANGGIRSDGTSGSPVIRNNTISGNDASTVCGGININATSTSGTVIVSGNKINGNHAPQYPGGASIKGSVRFIGNIVSDNYAAMAAGMLVDDGAIVTNNIIKDNYLTGLGYVAAGIHVGSTTATITNNTIVGNHGTGSGWISAISCWDGTTVTISNNIVAFNQGGIYKTNAANQVTLANNDVYSNTNGNYSNNLTADSGSISLDPLFANASGSDYHIQSTSPCRDAGYDSASGLPDSDIDGEDRIYGGWVDIGADEYWPTRIFDASLDFSINDNPSGSWSYGWTPDLDQNYQVTLYDMGITHTESPLVNLNRWYSSSLGTEPSVTFNPTDVAITGGTTTWPAHTVAITPGQSDQKSVIHWTASASGTYAISTRFWDITGGNTSTDVHILQNGTSLFSGAIRNLNEGTAPRVSQPFQTYTTVLTLSAGDELDFAVGYGEDGDNSSDTTGVEIRITSAVDTGDLQFDHGLSIDPAKLNQSAGANRCNIRWASTDQLKGYGDDCFVLPSGQEWVIDTIRVWTVPEVPAFPSYCLGQHYQSVTLYGGTTTGGLAALSSGEFSNESNYTNNPSIVAAPVTYYQNCPGYQRANGEFNQLWQVDFNNLNWIVDGGVTYVFGVYGVPRVDRLWFSHATNKELTGWTSGDGQLRLFDTSNLTGSISAASGSPWFGGKGSDINIQVFAHASN